MTTDDENLGPRGQLIVLGDGLSGLIAGPYAFYPLFWEGNGLRPIGRLGADAKKLIEALRIQAADWKLAGVSRTVIPDRLGR